MLSLLCDRLPRSLSTLQPLSTLFCIHILQTENTTKTVTNTLHKNDKNDTDLFCVFCLLCSCITLWTFSTYLCTHVFMLFVSVLHVSLCTTHIWTLMHTSVCLFPLLATLFCITYVCISLCVPYIPHNRGWREERSCIMAETCATNGHSLLSTGWCGVASMRVLYAFWTVLYASCVYVHVCTSMCTYSYMYVCILGAVFAWATNTWYIQRQCSFCTLILTLSSERNSNGISELPRGQENKTGDGDVYYKLHVYPLYIRTLKDTDSRLSIFNTFTSILNPYEY